ncbi:hypothetical protein L209DRAFT_54713 [Thermothelomyces heterothallicus CBS 203.75]
MQRKSDSELGSVVISGGMLLAAGTSISISRLTSLSSSKKLSSKQHAENLRRQTRTRALGHPSIQNEVRCLPLNGGGSSCSPKSPDPGRGD